MCTYKFVFILKKIRILFYILFILCFIYIITMIFYSLSYAIRCFTRFALNLDWNDSQRLLYLFQISLLATFIAGV